MVGNFDYGCPLCGEYVHEATADMESESSWVRFAAGHWTREPVEVMDWYPVAIVRPDNGKTAITYKILLGDLPFTIAARWSAPLPPLPPVPEGE